jgi:hypothetical protein
MADLHVCYSPKGEKFELTKANYLDCTQHFGFTTTPPSNLPAVEAEVEADAEPEVEADAEPEAEVEAEAEIEDAEEAAFDPEDKDSVKAYLRANEIEFDGRASLADLVDLANGE